MQELGAQYEDRVEAIRCPDCGGLNPADADWCGQCLKPFAPPAVADTPGHDNRAGAPPVTTGADPLVAPSPSPTAPPGGSAGDGFDPLFDPLGIGFGSATATPAIAPPNEIEHPEPEISTPSPVLQRRGAFAVAGDDISWTCDRCDTDNELAARMCRVCGTQFGDTVQPRPSRPQRDPNTAALVSLFFPGAGHAYLQMWNQAIARAAMSTWVVGVAIVAALQRGVPGSGLIVALFGLTAFALWGVAAHDAYREASDDPHAVILRPRMFLYVTMGLLFLLFVSLMAAGIAANR